MVRVPSFVPYCMVKFIRMVDSKSIVLILFHYVSVFELYFSCQTIVLQIKCLFSEFLSFALIVVY